jgi:hypothetical protein
MVEAEEVVVDVLVELEKSLYIQLDVNLEKILLAEKKN